MEGGGRGFADGQGAPVIVVYYNIVIFKERTRFQVRRIQIFLHKVFCGNLPNLNVVLALPRACEGVGMIATSERFQDRWRKNLVTFQRPGWHQEGRIFQNLENL